MIMLIKLEISVKIYIEAARYFDISYVFVQIIIAFK